MKKLALALVVILVIAVIYWQSQKDERPQVTLAKVEQGTVRSTVANTRAGTLEACRRSKLSMPVGGKVDQLLVDEGDMVKAGDMLLSLWNEPIKAQLAQAQAQAEVARISQQQACLTAQSDQREANRLHTLIERKLASTEQADLADTKAASSELACKMAGASLESARAQVGLVQSQLEQTELFAPFDGVVAEINGDLGEYVTPSPPGVATPPAVDLIDTGCLYITAPIDEVDAASLRLGQSAEITLDAFEDRIFPGELTRIAPYVQDYEKQARTVTVDVGFRPTPQDVALLVGYSADVTLILDQSENTLRVPSEAINNGNEVLVYNAASGALEARTIKTGLSNWNYTEVLDGLTAGEQVVTSLGTAGVEAGAEVSPRP